MATLISILVLLGLYEAFLSIALKLHKVHPDRVKDFKSACFAGAISFILAQFGAAVLVGALFGTG